MSWDKFSFRIYLILVFYSTGIAAFMHCQGALMPSFIYIFIFTVSWNFFCIVYLFVCSMSYIDIVFRYKVGFRGTPSILVFSYFHILYFCFHKMCSPLQAFCQLADSMGLSTFIRWFECGCQQLLGLDQSCQSTTIRFRRPVETCKNRIH